MKSGIINVYKEEGFTSFDVVAKLRGILHFKKLGHTGTLDPMATGVLPVCVGKATKVCDLLTNKDKTYRATMLLGKRTDTLDVTGEVLSESPVEVSPQQVEAALLGFLGESLQVPPMYSALKVDGKRLYELARAGVEVERKARPITIHQIKIERIELPYVTFTVTCSKGTYIRSLIDDVGQLLGCGATMSALERTQVSSFNITESLTLAELQQLADEGRVEEAILPIDRVFENYEGVRAKAEATKLIENGGGVPLELLEEEVGLAGANCEAGVEAGGEDSRDNSYRLYLSDGRFAGIYRLEEDRLSLVKLFLE